MKKNLLILLCIILSVSQINSQENWELLNPKPTTNTGKDVVFVSNSTGYVITLNEILETKDSGASWQKKRTISSGNDISFYKNNGYIVGNYGYILKSVDSGNSWFQINTGFNHSFNSVHIIDEYNILLSSSNSIVKSNDGGETWQSLNIPNVTVIKTFFVSDLIGHAACRNGTMLKTVDGGQNWYVTQSTNSFPSDFFTVYFINENIGFSTQEHSDMFKTIDGGETWTEVKRISDAIYSMFFLNENIGYASGDHGVIFKTIDGGNTWTWAGFQNGRYGSTSMYGIYFENENIGYATGARGRIIKTTDGGNTWTQNSLTYNNFCQLQFIDSNTGYAQSGNSFYKTSDSGDNWKLTGSLNLGTSVSAGNFTFVNEELGYATTTGTYGGHVFKTNNGGVTWKALNNGYDIIDEGIASIFFLDSKIGFISGGFNQRKVMKTIDGGLTWVKVENLVFGQIQFLNSQVGYGNRIGNSFHRIYKTIDGGDNWDYVFEIEEDIKSLHFLDENNGYFVGDNGLIQKTIDGGKTWQKLSIPYEYYELVKFYSKNVGYIADEDGKIYKTMNGGKSWEYLTTQYGINSIEIINDKIYTAGSNGKIYRSDVSFDSIVLNVNPVENISNSSVSLVGNVTSNGVEVSDIEFFVSRGNTISASPNSIAANESLDISTDLTNLDQNTTYYYRLKGTHNSKNYFSRSLSFTTLSDYQITTNYLNKFSAVSAEVSGSIVSNENDITNIEFEYGTSKDALNTTVNGSLSLVKGNTSENIIGNFDNLMPETKYFYRIKATHKGVDIYGDILSFKTYPEYNINLRNIYINGNEINLSAYIAAYNKDITDIVFEYGTINYENNIVTNPSSINANRSEFISAKLSDLDPNSTYYYRVKAMHNEEKIYSEEGVFNISRNIVMVSGTISETDYNSLELKGLVNSYGAYLTDIKFEYGVTDSLGSFINGTPNYVFSGGTNLIKATINNPIPDQTYFYRLVASHNSEILQSDIYQYKTGILSTNNFYANEQISIYPNPANDFININMKSIDAINTIEIYNLVGKRVSFKEKILASKVIKVETKNLRKGIYLLKVNFENNKIVYRKFIIN